MKKLILLLQLLITVACTQAQLNNSDSLHQVLKTTSNDTLRMDIYRQLGFYFYTKNPDSAHYYLEEGTTLANSLGLKLYESGLLGGEAYLFSWNNYPKAFELLSRALKIAEDPASEKTAWSLDTNMSPHKERLSNLGFIYFSLAQLYGNTDNVEMQISNLLKARNTAESVADSGLNLLANLNLGNVYQDKLKKPDSALYFEQTALSSFSKSAGSETDIGWVYSTMATIYQEKRNFDPARDAFHKGLKWMLKQNNLAGVGGIYLSLSNFYKTINKTDSGLIYGYRALETYKQFKDQVGIAGAYTAISAAYADQNKADSALAYLQLATSLHDSLNKAERKNLLTYQHANFDEQLRVKDLETEKIETRAKIRTYALLAGIAVFITVAFLLYRNSNHRKKANQLLQKEKEEVNVQKENVEKTLIELKAAQAQLIQTAKMASLGELTAGIAHEIQNPLNFVNNFSELNKEMLEELKAERLKSNADKTAETTLINDIIANEDKINHHGKRADSIVKGMLQHAGKSEGIKQPTDINALCKEYFQLSYQGLRVKDKQFNTIPIAIGMKTDFETGIGQINIIPQDIGRVLLNLYNNAFYAVKAARAQREEQYVPTVTVKTKKVGDKVSISVRDNGTGISQNILDKVFQPFFTTKPAGQGTGLGLSLSYDILKAHGGEIVVSSTEGEGSEFAIFLPA